MENPKKVSQTKADLTIEIDLSQLKLKALKHIKRRIKEMIKQEESRINNKKLPTDE